MSRVQNPEFQEWWNKQREFLDQKNTDANSFLSIDISTSASSTSASSADPAAAKNNRTRSARQLSWLWRLKLQQLFSSLTWLSTASISLIRTANRRIFSHRIAASDSSSSRLYRIIKFFLVLVILLLCVELVAYFKGWHFSPPSVESAEAAVERVYAKWLDVRAAYLAPPLQSLTNVCVVLFLIQSVDRVVLVLGCFWIKLRKLKPVANVEYNRENVEDYPMVLVQIPMCNEREVRSIM